ncbi:MAG: Hsp20 family protein [Chitinivibrionales bacterium]|nr:Hsp20 family protein [Chitinivibrionales bacterium]
MSALVPYNPRVLTLRQLIDQLMEPSVFGLLDREIGEVTWPRVDVTEDNDVYRLEADLPGMSRESIGVTVEKGVLTIRGEKKTGGMSREHRYAHLERRYGAFSRSFKVPGDVEPDSIEASYRDGVLEVILKKGEQSLPRKIEVAGE